MEKLLTKQVYESIKERTDPKNITQIRLRVNSPLIINLFDEEIFCDNIIIDEETIRETFNKITGYSAYAFEENIRCGYLTAPGGHRVGFGGEAVMENGNISTIKNIRFINIRISHSIKGCGKKIVSSIMEKDDIRNTLIISPPGKGKTTLLRDLVNLFSNNIYGTSICVIDERNEISGSYMGVPTMELGPRTDVISNCSKEEGIKMAVRSMAPRIIAVDEIGGDKDMEALLYASLCGVKIIATIHGQGIEDAEEKLGQAYNKIFEKKVLIKDKGEYICY